MTAKTIAEIKYAMSVEHIVAMDQFKIVQDTEAIGTYGLCGCTCIFAQKPGLIYLAHYSPLTLNRFPLEIAAFAPSKAVVITPGDWHKTKTGWELMPKIPVLNFEHWEYRAYSEMVSFDETLLSRSVRYIASHGLLIGDALR